MSNYLHRFVAQDSAATPLLAVIQGDAPGFHRFADALVSLACLGIATYLILHYLCPWRRRKVPYCEIAWLVAGFLGFSGVAHLLDAVAVGPESSATSAAALVLAAGSWATMLVLALRVRKVQSVRDPEDFEKEIAERQRVEDALRRSEAMARKLAHVASRTDNAVIITDAEGRIEWVNDGFTRITEYTLDEAAGRSPGSLLQGEETDPETASMMRQRVRAGEGFQAEVINYARSGRKYWIALEVQPIHDDAGRLTNFIAVESDITGRKRDERRLEVQNATMQVLASCNRLEEAMPRLLATIGQTLDFDAGEFWLVDPGAGELRLKDRPWISPRVPPRWVEASIGMRLGRGTGLCGRVCDSGRSAWIPDLSDASGRHLIRRGLALRSGLRSAFSFPVVASEEGPILGVMTFLSRERLDCDDALLRAMTTLGRKIGLFAERRRAEAALTQVNARLNAILAASTQVAIIATDPDGLITVFNSGAERMLGYSAGEMVGKATPEVIHVREEVRAHSARLTREFGTPVTGFATFVERARRGGHDVGEWTYVRKDGSRLTVLLAVTAVADAEGQIGGFLGIATDVSERQRVERRLRSSESRFRRLVDSNIFGVVFGDIDGRITEANDAFLEMIGYSRSEMLDGRLPWAAFLTTATPHLRRSLVELRRRGRCNPFELQCRRKDGQLLPVLVGVALLDESRPAEPGAPVVAFCVDVSERRRLEDQLRKQASELAEANTRKNEFLAMLGHELRNPLAPIRNAVKIMKQRDSSDPMLRWAREVIDYQMKHMTQLVDDLLEISRVTRGKVRLQKDVVDVATIVAYAVETSRPVIDSHRHHLSISLPPGPIQVHADQVRMAQVLSNLLNNAAKYTDEGGQIRLIVRAEGPAVAFRVRDNGVGIPPEMLSRVFDLFTQVERSLDRSQGGLGLGLTLVRSLVEMHGGSVTALSDGPGQGSEFVVVLPLWVPEPPSEDEAPEPDASRRVGGGAIGQGSPQPRRVLVVDDMVTSAQSLELLLSLEGHEVQVVHDGPDALAALERRGFDVVLMDIGLPGMNGYEVARRIRDRGDLDALLLVAVTGYAEDEARLRSREAGFDHHLVKPVDPDAILAMLASMEWSRTGEDAGGPRGQAVACELR